MTPFTSVTKTRVGDCALAGPATAVAMHSSTKPANHVDHVRKVRARKVRARQVRPRQVKHAVIRASDEPSDGNASAVAHTFRFNTNIGWRSPQGNAHDRRYRGCRY